MVLHNKADEHNVTHDFRVLQYSFNNVVNISCKVGNLSCRKTDVCLLNQVLFVFTVGNAKGVCYRQ